MDEKKEPTKSKTESTKEKVEMFNFTRDGIVIEAKNLEEAEKQLKKTLTENKGSNDG